jgi:hypothetical protein
MILLLIITYVLLLFKRQKSEFSNRLLRGINAQLDFWLELPTIGLSGGILFGCDSAKFHVDKTIVRQYSLTVFLTNRLDIFSWCCIVVYGPVDNSLKGEFWEKLNLLGTEVLEAWFNNNQTRISKKFNNFLDHFNLFQYELQDRKFTWSNGTQFALLDRIVGSLQWNSQYRRCTIKDLPKNGSDHCPLLLSTNGPSLENSTIFRFDLAWLEIPKF